MVGRAGPENTSGKRRFWCYLENEEKRSIRFAAWADAADKLADQLSLSTVTFCDIITLQIVRLEQYGENKTKTKVFLSLQNIKLTIHLKIYRAWSKGLRKVKPHISLFQIVELKNVNVRPYWVDKSAKNITDSELELSYHDTNTRLTVIPVPDEDKPVLQDYDEERKFPPYWRYLENVMKPWEKYLGMI